jgi:hypothetical protein
MDDSPGFVLGLALMGLIGGVVLFARGLVAYRRDRLISAVATSSLDGLAAGEVRVSGLVQAVDQQLTSPLQSRPCVWYRARIESTDDSRRVLLDEERAVHFRVIDGRGSIRVAPAGARWEIDPDFDESTSLTGAEPPGLERRRGASYDMVLPDDPGDMTDAQRQAAIDALLTVDRPASPEASDGTGGFGLLGGILETSRGRRYREARLEVGETVTIIGQALPWADVRQQLEAVGNGGNVERAIADDIADARAAGELAATPEEAWGNAAIPGFGIGQPTRPPELDPDAQPPRVAGPTPHEAAMDRYEIPADELVLARAPDGALALAIYRGTPQAATQQHDLAFVLGLVGAVMAVCCTLALGAVLTGSL